MKTQIKKVLILGSSLLMLSLLTGCDFTDYKTRIQRENDINNPTGNKSVCLRVGKVYEDMYPYTIHYVEGEIDPKEPYDKVKQNRRLNLKLSLYAKEGLFTEELVGHDGDKPLYRYNLTDEGRKYVDWWGGTNFCFGRVVVEKVTGVDDQLQGQRVIIFTYHLENVPNWIKNKDIYSLYKGYGGLEKAVLGERPVKGAHNYSISSDGRLSLIRARSGSYIL
ncbi:hypothetical protein A9G36_04020 [Gilliamella sp. Choc6-1]|uniref:hypothetical protein n=1 Tax=Gilliamella sp. Choc6-1 TaxID=3120239 RepID=UPI00080DBF60|nr:hypothetical protein [Gilliamella apicola]OCG56014.1 hypothetical protein A9G36_04020 [Gilliamella apicola]